MVRTRSCLWPFYAYRIRSKCCTAKLILSSTQNRLSVKYNNYEFSQCIHRPYGSKHLLQTRFVVVDTAPPHERPHRTIIGVSQRAETRICVSWVVWSCQYSIIYTTRSAQAWGGSLRGWYLPIVRKASQSNPRLQEHHRFGQLFLLQPHGRIAVQNRGGKEEGFWYTTDPIEGKGST